MLLDDKFLFFGNRVRISKKISKQRRWFNRQYVHCTTTIKLAVGDRRLSMLKNFGKLELNLTVLFSACMLWEQVSFQSWMINKNGKWSVLHVRNSFRSNDTTVCSHIFVATYKKSNIITSNSVWNVTQMSLIITF